MQNNLVDIPDEELRKAICSVLNKDVSEDVTIDDMEQIKELSFWADKEVTTLEGLQYASNLIMLSIGFYGYGGSDLSYLPKKLSVLSLVLSRKTDFKKITLLDDLFKLTIIDNEGLMDFNDLIGVNTELMYFDYTSGVYCNNNSKSLNFVMPLTNITSITTKNCDVLNENGEPLYLGVLNNKSFELNYSASNTTLVDISDFERKGFGFFKFNSFIEIFDPLVGSEDIYMFQNVFNSTGGRIPVLGMYPPGEYNEKTGDVIFKNTKGADYVGYSVEKLGGRVDFSGVLLIKNAV
ncbi:hypothetical protein H0S68_25465 (plasmid) [Serratia sp. AXJ-M]|uniref:hypothetical protein n=1 Tax=Serratia sp. AXJ-M TaxID=2754727 RepID=UPI00397CFE91